MALTTAAAVKRRLPGFDAADTDSDTLIAELISAADEVIATWCGYPPTSAGAAPDLESQTYTRYYGGRPEHFGIGADGSIDSRVLVLDVLPVSSIPSIHDDSQWSYGSAELVDSGDYTLEGETGRVYLDPDATQGAFSRVSRAVKAIYVAGWATVPDQVAEAALQLIAHWFQLPSRQGRSSLSKAGGSTSWRTEGMPESVQELLSPYRLPRVLCP